MDLPLPPPSLKTSTIISFAQRRIEKVLFVPSSRRGREMEIESNLMAYDSVMNVIIVRQPTKTLDTEAQVSFVVSDTH